MRRDSMRWYENPSKVKVLPLGLGTHPRFALGKKKDKEEEDLIYLEELHVEKIGKKMFFVRGI